MVSSRLPQFSDALIKTITIYWEQTDNQEQMHQLQRPKRPKTKQQCHLADTDSSGIIYQRAKIKTHVSLTIFCFHI